MGPDLMAKFQAQAERFGTEVVYDDVVELDLDGPVKRVTLGNGETHEAAALIYATGSAYRKLGLPEEEILSGHGLSWCATCDGFFFRQKTIAVVGGGDSAMEEATFLTRFADKVYVIHRRDSLQGLEDHAAARVRQREDRVRLEHRGHRDPRRRPRSPASTLRDTVTGDERALDLDGLFVAIGNDPRTHLVHGKLELTPEGTIAVDGRIVEDLGRRRLRGRRRDRPDLPAGRHRRRFGHGRRARRRALPRRPRRRDLAEAAVEADDRASVAIDHLADVRDRPTAAHAASASPKGERNDCTCSDRGHLRAGGPQQRQGRPRRLLGRVVRPVSRGQPDPRPDRDRARRQARHRQAQRRREPADSR